MRHIHEPLAIGVAVMAARALALDAAPPVAPCPTAASEAPPELSSDVPRRAVSATSAASAIFWRAGVDPSGRC